MVLRLLTQVAVLVTQLSLRLHDLHDELLLDHEVLGRINQLLTTPDGHESLTLVGRAAVLAVGSAEGHGLVLVGDRRRRLIGLQKSIMFTSARSFLEGLDRMLVALIRRAASLLVRAQLRRLELAIAQHAIITLQLLQQLMLLLEVGLTCWRRYSISHII